MEHEKLDPEVYDWLKRNNYDVGRDLTVEQIAYMNGEYQNLNLGSQRFHEDLQSIINSRINTLSNLMINSNNSLANTGMLGGILSLTQKNFLDNMALKTINSGATWEQNRSNLSQREQNFKNKVNEIYGV